MIMKERTFNGGDNLKFEVNHTFGLPRNIVWKYMKDEVVLKNSIPNCRAFREVSKGYYQAEIYIQLGPIKDIFHLEVRIEKEKQPSFYQLLVKGKGKVGEIKGTVLIQINEASKLTGEADAEMAGALAAASDLVLNKRNKGIVNFFQTVEREIKKKIYQQRRGKS
jgi:uncharacterized protein